jgi:hypothetical protein
MAVPKNDSERREEIQDNESQATADYCEEGQEEKGIGGKGNSTQLPESWRRFEVGESEA